jgi:hypothetical protein
MGRLNPVVNAIAFGTSVADRTQYWQILTVHSCLLDPHPDKFTDGFEVLHTEYLGKYP